MLSVMGAFAEFERALLKERQREGIELAKKRGVYKGRKNVLSDTQVTQVCNRVSLGEKKAGIAREFGISRETLYRYLNLNVSPAREDVASSNNFSDVFNSTVNLFVEEEPA